MTSALYQYCCSPSIHAVLPELESLCVSRIWLQKGGDWRGSNHGAKSEQTEGITQVPLNIRPLVSLTLFSML